MKPSIWRGSGGPQHIGQVLRPIIQNMKYDKFRVRKIDSRNKLFGQFDYQVKCHVDDFIEMRDWCWTTWGSSVEYFWWHDFKHHPGCNSSWCFDTDYSNTNKRRLGIIYLATDQEMDLWTLKYGNKG